jgi:tRNA threonylcarbamoyladenosine biosynthesis protein TsaE
MFSVTSTMPEETERAGELLGSLARPGDFVSLIGDLGAGKTCFSRGVARGVGVDPTIPVTSPTFTLLNIYQGRIPLYHFDLYRLTGDGDLADLGFVDYFDGDGLCLVEWAERLEAELPSERLDIVLRHEDESIRRLEFSAFGGRHLLLLEEMMANGLGNRLKTEKRFDLTGVS